MLIHVLHPLTAKLHASALTDQIFPWTSEAKQVRHAGDVRLSDPSLPSDNPYVNFSGHYPDATADVTESIKNRIYQFTYRHN
jgi:hypothetical protein